MNLKRYDSPVSDRSPHDFFQVSPTSASRLQTASCPIPSSDHKSFASNNLMDVTVVKSCKHCSFSFRSDVKQTEGLEFCSKGKCCDAADPSEWLTDRIFLIAKIEQFLIIKHLYLNLEKHRLSGLSHMVQIIVSINTRQAHRSILISENCDWESDSCKSNEHKWENETTLHRNTASLRHQWLL